MITGDHDWLQGIAKLNLCAEHKSPLEVAWYDKCWVLRCDAGAGHYPDVLIRNPSLTEEWKQGTLDNATLVDKIKRGSRRRAMQQGNQLTHDVLALLPKADLGTGELLTPEAFHALIKYAQNYGLDPYRGHVVLMHGKPYIGLDGYLYHANRSGKAYTLQSRPMTSLEVIEYKIEPTDFGWVAEVIFTLSGAKFNGTGIVTYAEMTAKSDRDPSKFKAPVVAKHPWQLAQKRAEWQAMRRAFPIGETKKKEDE